MPQPTNARDEQKHKPKSFSHPFQEIKGAHNGSLVHRFITSGKPGNCSFCNKLVQKLEEHHVQYNPELTIKLCHDCHHKTHFWPQRLSAREKYHMLRLIRPDKEARIIAFENKLTNVQLAKMIAPSRSGFVHAQQKAFAETGEMRVVPVETPEPTDARQPALRKIDTAKLMFNKKKHL